MARVDVWTKRGAGDDNSWRVGQELAIFQPSLSALGGILQSFGYSGCRANHKVAGQQRTERHMGGESS